MTPALGEWVWIDGRLPARVERVRPVRRLAYVRITACQAVWLPLAALKDERRDER